MTVTTMLVQVITRRHRVRLPMPANCQDYSASEDPWDQDHLNLLQRLPCHAWQKRKSKWLVVPCQPEDHNRQLCHQPRQI